MVRQLRRDLDATRRNVGGIRKIGKCLTGVEAKPR